MGAAPKIILSISHAMQILDFPGNGEGSSLAFPPSIYSSSRLGSEGGGVLNTIQTWKTTTINIDRTILVCLKGNFFLPYFSRTCTAKAKAVMVKKNLRMLHYSCILNQVIPACRKACNKGAPKAKSVKNLHARPARMP